MLAREFALLLGLILIKDLARAGVIRRKKFCQRRHSQTTNGKRWVSVIVFLNQTNLKWVEARFGR